jgi:hypothetical protein
MQLGIEGDRRWAPETARNAYIGTPGFERDALRVDEHPVHYFWRLIDQLLPAHYPPGVTAVEEHFRGTAAFSAGAGLFRAPGEPLPLFPCQKVMFVGHNLFSEDTYRGWLARDVQPGGKMPYWRKLKLLLAAAGLDREDAFFTNYFIGLKQGSESLGLFPGADHATFCGWCERFLDEQIRVMRPALVVALGKEARARLSCEDERALWCSRGGVDFTLIGMTHPSYTRYEENANGRRFYEQDANRLHDALP